MRADLINIIYHLTYNTPPDNQEIDLAPVSIRETGVKLSHDNGEVDHVTLCGAIHKSGI